MERKRKLPARNSRSEPANKRRDTISPDRTSAAASPTITLATSPSPAPVEDPLPKSISSGTSLPTLEEAQPENLSSKEFQSISDSGVLAESLQRSRQKWVSEGIFEKYWTKPMKKKGQPSEPPNNPAKESMTKLGTCTITIEPHIFDATMFAAKEPKTAIPQQMYRPIIQYGPPNGVMPPTPIQAPIPVQQKPIQTPLPANKSTSNANTSNRQTPSTPTSQPPVANGQPTQPPVANGQPTQPPNTKAPNSPQPSNTAQPPPQGPPNKSTDPVIQMLAERASIDADLKALMRIVANGEASPTELRRFQNHIDELTQLSGRRKAAAQTPSNSSPRPPPTAQMTGQIKSEPTSNPSPSIIKATPSTMTTPSHPPPQPQALRSKGPVAPPKSDISGVVLEFSGGNGDRFLFPKYSILDYLPGGQVIASFLIVRKGSSSDSTCYDPELDYYQPVTIRLYTHQGKQLESLQKAVAPADEVRRYMDDVMDNMTRAEYVLLAMRLPKGIESPPTETEDDPVKVEKVDTPPNTVLWQTTNPSPPQPVSKSPAKRLLTEEENYQSFIQAVT